MAITTPTKTVRTLIAVGTNNAVGNTVRGTADLRTAYGGILTARITNLLPLTTQAVCNVLVAHTTGATPAAGSQGADWKLLWSFGGGLANGQTTEQAILIDPSVMHLCVEITGNVGGGVNCEALLSELTNFDTA